MKKFLAIVMAAIMILSVMSFASAELAGEYDITIWVAENAVDLTKQQIEDFNASNEDGIKFNATVEAVSEADAATQMITDVEAGGDRRYLLLRAGPVRPSGAGRRSGQARRQGRRNGCC